MLRIEHVITADDALGDAWPPDGACSVVRHLSNGFTLWRRISLQSEIRAPASPPAARDSSGGTT
jgi:hypothetical protein